MIDLHCHILPNIDDGAKHLTESIEMARKAYEEGISIIVATPHHKHERYDNERQKVEEQVIVLNEALKKENIPINVVSGQEIRVYGELVEDYKSGAVKGLHESKYILVEFPSNHVPRYVDQLFHDLQMNGLVPVIAHPERNREFLENPGILYRLINNGVIAQLTAGSLVGRFGKKIKKFSFDLIDARLVHIIASDAHNVKNRTFHMAEAFDIIEQEYGAQGSYYFKENAEYIFRNEMIYRENPEKVKRKKFLGLF